MSGYIKKLDDSSRIKKCCEKKDIYIVSGRQAGMGAPCYLDHICCANCGTVTNGVTWWYTGYSDDEIIEMLISLWNSIEKPNYLLQ